VEEHSNLINNEHNGRKTGISKRPTIPATVFKVSHLYASSTDECSEAPRLLVTGKIRGNRFLFCI
jgi:hypothetical protein